MNACIIRRLALLSAVLLASANFAAPSRAEARALQCADIQELLEQFLRNHYAFHKLTDPIKTHTVEQFIKILDSMKVNFLESDVAQIRQQLAPVFAEVGRGNCASLENAHELLVKRTRESKEFIEKFLGPNYKLDESSEVITNPDLRPWPKTEAERNANLAKFAHFQVSNYLLADTKLEEAKRLIRKRNELGLKRAVERRKNEIYDYFMEAFARSLDPHSSYMSADTLEDFQISMQLSLEGIGASLTSEDGYTVIEELIPGGAAAKSKQLKPKDKIIAVAQDGQQPVAVLDMDLREVVKLIRGKKGTKVRLSILRQGEKSENFQITLVRDKVDLKEQAAKLTFQEHKEGSKTYKIGIIELPSFYGGGKGEGRSCYQDMLALVKQANKAKVDGLILDLTKNGGGLLDQAVQIAGLFIRKGGVVSTKSTEGRVETLEDQDPEIFYTGPLAVLTSHLSASASEILAGALKDYHRALIIGGDHTFGKGTVQVLAPLPSGLGAMKVTTGMFFVPSGLSTQHLGVTSDIVLPSVLNSEEIGEKKLDYSLDQQKIESFISPEANGEDPAHHWIPIDPNYVPKLSNKALERVTKNEKFIKIRKEVDEAARNKGLVKLAELRAKANEDKKNGKKKDKKKSRGKHVDSEEDTAFVHESANIMVDLIQLEHPT